MQDVVCWCVYAFEHATGLMKNADSLWGRQAAGGMLICTRARWRGSGRWLLVEARTRRRKWQRSRRATLHGRACGFCTRATASHRRRTHAPLLLLLAVILLRGEEAWPLRRPLCCLPHVRDILLRRPISAPAGWTCRHESDRPLDPTTAVEKRKPTRREICSRIHSESSLCDETRIITTSLPTQAEPARLRAGLIVLWRPVALACACRQRP